MITWESASNPFGSFNVELSFEVELTGSLPITAAGSAMAAAQIKLRRVRESLMSCSFGSDV
jgi:hypothetical protein